MRISAVVLSIILTVSSLHALHDYRCTERSLCELQEYKKASSLDEAFSEGKVEGEIRLAYIDQDNHAEGTRDTHATSIGGQLKYETAKFHHISLAVSAFVSQKMAALSGDQEKGELNPDFFDADGNSFVYLGEAYAHYGYKQFDLRIGRQKIDTPLNDRDDIRMLPNTFEALMAGYGGIKDFVFAGGYIRRWAGFDSGSDISRFKTVPGTIDATGEEGEGVFLLGVMNESLEETEIQAWYYDFDKQADVFYLDAVYGTEYDSGLGVEAGVQFGNYQEKSSSRIEGDVYGGVLGLGIAGVSLGAAFNDVDTNRGKSIILGYGGGPYFTSMEEMTIDAINDTRAYVFSVEVDFSRRMLEGLSLAYAYGKFEGNDGAGDAREYVENDIVLSYGIGENTYIEASYASVGDRVNSGTADTGYDRVLVRANYTF